MTSVLFPVVLATMGLARADPPAMKPGKLQPIVGDQTPRADASCTSEIRREKTKFLDTGSICMEGARAHIDGRGCTTIRWKLEEAGEYLFFCETQDTCDITHTGTFIAYPSGVPVQAAYADDQVFCVDNNYTLFYRPGLPADNGPSE